MFHSFFLFPNKVELLIFLSSFQVYSLVSRDSKVHNSTNSLFLLTIIRSGGLAEFKWSLCIPWGVCPSSLLVVLFNSLKSFYMSVSWWFSAGVWVTVSLLKSPGLFSVFWVISIMLQFGQSPLVSLFPSPQFLATILWGLTKSTNYNWYNRQFHVPQFFQFPGKVQVLIFLFAFSQFYFMIRQDSKLHNPSSSLFFFFFFFVDYYKVSSSGRDKVICLYLKIPEEFVRLVLQNIFWVMHIPFVRMVKLQFLAQFPVDHPAHPDVLSLILFLC